MDMSNACHPPIHPQVSAAEKQHPRYSEYQRYRSAMTSQIVSATPFSLWLEQTEKHEQGCVAVYEVMPGARLAVGWWKNVFGPGHRLIDQYGPFPTKDLAVTARREIAIRLGEVIEGRCVSTNLKLRGKVVAVFQPQPGTGDSCSRYQISEATNVDNPEWPPVGQAMIFA